MKSLARCHEHPLIEYRLTSLAYFDVVTAREQLHRLRVFRRARESAIDEYLAIFRFGVDSYFSQARWLAVSGAR
jgi:hypothetical protein